MKNIKGIVSHKAFTLVELIVVMAIIVILGAIAIPSYIEFTKEANRTDARQTILRLATMQERYYLQNKQYATNIDWLFSQDSSSSSFSTGQSVISGATNPTEIDTNGTTINYTSQDSVLSDAGAYLVGIGYFARDSSTGEMQNLWIAARLRDDGKDEECNLLAYDIITKKIVGYSSNTYNNSSHTFSGYSLSNGIGDHSKFCWKQTDTPYQEKPEETFRQ